LPERDDQWHRDTQVPLRFAHMTRPLGSASFRSQDDGGLNLEAPEFRTIDSPLPDWATSELCSRILRAIDRFRYAHVNTDELRVFVPEMWISERDRQRGMARGGRLFGVRLEMYPGRQVIVGHYLEVE
jgi:hypothetical protein